MKRKIQTTSTKCQYHAAASSPKWWWVVRCMTVHRHKQVNRNSDPMITCSPWNPVAIKKVEP